MSPPRAVSAPSGDLCGSRKTPAATFVALNKALNIALANADVKEKFARTGTEPAMSTPEGLEKIRLTEIEKWRRVIVASGYKAD